MFLLGSRKEEEINKKKKKKKLENLANLRSYVVSSSFKHLLFELFILVVLLTSIFL